MTTLTFPRGAPISIDLVINDPGNLTPSALTCAMKLKQAWKGEPPSADSAAVATFGVSFVAAAGASLAYWRGSIAATITAALLPGLYAADAELKSGGVVIAVTAPVLIQIEPSVTPA